MIQQALQRAEWQRHSHSGSVQEVEAYQAWLLLMQGDEAAALRWVQRSGLDLNQELYHLREREYLTVARVLIIAEANQWLTNLLRLAEAQGRPCSVIEILMLQAQAFHASGEVNQALEPLSRALSSAEPERYIRLFLDEGTPMARLLDQMRAYRWSKYHVSTSYREQLLVLLGKASDVDISQSTPAFGSNMDQLAEPLSERELEVLRLIVAGLSASQVAVSAFNQQLPQAPMSFSPFTPTVGFFVKLLPY